MRQAAGPSNFNRRIKRSLQWCLSDRNAKLIPSHINAMVGLEYEMTYREMIDGPLPSTKGSSFGERLCWQIVAGTLVGPRINARIATSGTDWMRIGPDSVRRQDLRAQLLTDKGVTILLHYDTGLIRASDGFLRALKDGAEATWSDQYMRMVPEFVVGGEKYAWLNRSLFLGEGRLSGRNEIEYSIYRVL